MRRAPVKEPAQRAPERNAPDASGAGGLRHEKAARPVWIGLARAGRTWHPATARIDRTHARVGRPRERDRLSPRRRPTDRLQSPSTNRPAALGPIPDGLRIGPHALFRGRSRGCGACASPPFRSAGSQPRKARSGSTGTASPPEDGPPTRPGGPAGTARADSDCTTGARRRPGVNPTAARGFEGSTHHDRSPPLRLARTATPCGTPAGRSGLCAGSQSDAFACCRKASGETSGPTIR